MSVWDRFNHQQQQRRIKQKRLAFLAAGGLVVALAAVALLLWGTPEPSETGELAGLKADLPAAQTKQSPAPVANGENRHSSQDSFAGDFGTASLTDTSQMAVEAARLARLEANLLTREVAQFQKQAVDTKRGPRQLSYIVSGSGRSHQFTPGQATFGETDIIGAAGEWLVRPWWKPGWVPNSADCGEMGTAAIAGHVSWAGRPGPFHDIGALVAGDEISCQAASGRWFTYTVTEVVRIDYTNTDYYWQSLEKNGRELTLFSCTPEITGIIVVRASIGG